MLETRNAKIPWGILGLQRLGILGTPMSHKIWTFIVTYLAYMTFHVCRKSISIASSSMVGSNSTDFLPNTTTPATGWAPFNNGDGNSQIGSLDSAFLFTYAIAMFISGVVAERVDVRYYLTAGMLLSATFSIGFGLGYVENIHVVAYFIVMQVFCGLFQTAGWPSVVAVVSNWISKGKRGLLLGCWNTMTSVGNIVGGLIASAALAYGWGYAFIFPAIFMIAMSVIVFLFMVVHPEVLGFDAPHRHPSMSETSSSQPLLSTAQYVSNAEDDDFENPPKPRAPTPVRYADQASISFFKAILIPGVIEFSLALFFSKLVNYTFLFWLPNYISVTPIDGKTLTNSQSGFLSTLFDVGGALGGILAGGLSDFMKVRATVAGLFLIFSIPSLYFYNMFGGESLSVNCGLMFLCGVLVNAPYALITTAVSADLGTHSSLKGNAKALSTVTAIIDGTGSLGAAVGPLITGLMTNSNSAQSWEDVFYMLMVMCGLAFLCLTRLIFKDIKTMWSMRKKPLDRVSSVVI